VTETRKGFLVREVFLEPIGALRISEVTNSRKNPFHQLHQAMYDLSLGGKEKSADGKEDVE
jgi:hypothetical protein